jgi:glycosyltransferase involved in cell wall biosynthesis
MKVVHISSLTVGGAGLCAKRIHQSLLEKGIKSNMLIAHGEETETIHIVQPDRDFWYSNRLIGKIKHLLLRLHLIKDKEYWDALIEKEKKLLPPNVYISHPFSNYKTLPHHPLIDEADIIHLHWVTGFVDFPSFFKQIKKPIVWTLHDENLGLGIFHLTTVSKDFRQRVLETDKIIKTIKQKSIVKAESVNLVAVSEVMRKYAQGNVFLSHFPISLIHNGIDPSSFLLHDRNECRKRLGLQQNALVFLFSAHYIHDNNKGLSLLIKALEMLNEPNVILVCIGGFDKAPCSPKISIRCIGRIADNMLLSSYYSSADFLMITSFQESFGQTAIESLACGTPVIAFPVGVIPELIKDVNGVICSAFTVDALVDGIKQARKKIYGREKLRKDVCEKFDYKVISNQYIELYKSIN